MTHSIVIQYKLNTVELTKQFKCKQKLSYLISYFQLQRKAILRSNKSQPCCRKINVPLKYFQLNLQVYLTFLELYDL